MPLGQQVGSSCSAKPNLDSKPSPAFELGWRHTSVLAAATSPTWQTHSSEPQVLLLCSQDDHSAPAGLLESLRWHSQPQGWGQAACWFLLSFVSRATGGFVGSDASVHRLLYWARLLPFLTAALMWTTMEYHGCEVWWSYGEMLGDVEPREGHYVNCDPNFTLDIFIIYLLYIHKNRRKHISLLVVGR